MAHSVSFFFNEKYFFLNKSLNSNSIKDGHHHLIEHIAFTSCTHITICFYIPLKQLQCKLYTHYIQTSKKNNVAVNHLAVTEMPI